VSSAPVLYIGQYRLLNVIYTGQTSQTWQAYDDRERRYVGIKTLFTDTSRDKEQVHYLKWEYKVGSQLHHDRIIDIFHFGWRGRIPYIVMEWFSAPNIKQWIHGGYEKYGVELPQIIPQMIEALAALHEAGWVHRDVKPDNFLYDSQKGVKLIDFALAKPIKGNIIAKLLKLKKQPQGTPTYMAPEQIRGLPVDGRADIYSLGCTFFELLGGRPTYTGNSINDLLYKHLSGPIPSINARNKNVTTEFANLLMSMMAKKCQDRPTTMMDVYRAVRGMKIFKKTPQPGDKIF